MKAFRNSKGLLKTSSACACHLSLLVLLMFTQTCSCLNELSVGIIDGVVGLTGVELLAQEVLVDDFVNLYPVHLVVCLGHLRDPRTVSSLCPPVEVAKLSLRVSLIGKSSRSRPAPLVWVLSQSGVLSHGCSQVLHSLRAVLSLGLQEEIFLPARSRNTKPCLQAAIQVSH